LLFTDVGTLKVNRIRMVGAMAREIGDAVIAYNVTTIIIITLLLTSDTDRHANEPKFTHSYRTLALFV